MGRLLIGRRFLSDVFLSLPESFESVVHRAQPFARLPRFRQASVPVTLVYMNALAAGLAAALHAGTFTPRAARSLIRFSRISRVVMFCSF